MIWLRQQVASGDRLIGGAWAMCWRGWKIINIEYSILNFQIGRFAEYANNTIKSKVKKQIWLRQQDRFRWPANRRRLSYALSANFEKVGQKRPKPLPAGLTNLKSAVHFLIGRVRITYVYTQPDLLKRGSSTPVSDSSAARGRFRPLITRTLFCFPFSFRVGFVAVGGCEIKKIRITCRCTRSSRSSLRYRSEKTGLTRELCVQRRKEWKENLIS